MYKKLIVLCGVIFMGPMRPAFADTILDQVQVALLGHVETVTETTTRGVTYGELLATPIQIGRMGGDYIAGIDAGVLGNIAPQAGQGGFNWTAGVHFHISPLLRKYVIGNINPTYTALSALEINPRVSLDFVNDHKVGVFGVAVGFAFGLTPIQ